MRKWVRSAGFEYGPPAGDGSPGTWSTARLLRLLERRPLSERLVALDDDRVVERLVALGAQLQLVRPDLEHEVVAHHAVEVACRAGERAVDVDLRRLRGHLQTDGASLMAGLRRRRQALPVLIVVPVRIRRGRIAVPKTAVPPRIAIAQARVSKPGIAIPERVERIVEERVIP